MNVCNLWAFGPLDQMSLFCRHICFALKADFFIEALRLRLLVALFFNPEMRSCSMCHGVVLRDSPPSLLGLQCPHALAEPAP